MAFNKCEIFEIPTTTGVIWLRQCICSFVANNELAEVERVLLPLEVASIREFNGYLRVYNGYSLVFIQKREGESRV